MSTPDERSRVGGPSAADEAPSNEWYENEVPGIVTGLERSGRLDDRVSDAAWTLIAEGRSRTALELVMGAVDAT